MSGTDHVHCPACYKCHAPHATAVAINAAVDATQSCQTFLANHVTLIFPHVSSSMFCFDMKMVVGAQARLDHATAVGKQQRVVEEEERAKMAALAEQMSNESAQREGDVRRRHEAAMTKLALNREQQVTHLPVKHTP